MADDDKPPFDLSQPFTAAAADKPAFDPSKPFDVPNKTSTLESGVTGAISGASAGWAPELGGLRNASGVPGWTPHTVFTDPALMGVGAARLAWEHATGNRGPATEQYEKTRDTIQQNQTQAQSSHPWAY